MTSHVWSESLREQTRRALSEIPVSPDGMLHVKHVDGHYGSMDILDLIAHIHRIRSRSTDEEWIHENVDAVLAAGWAID